MSISALQNFTYELKRCSLGRSARSTVIVGTGSARQAAFEKFETVAASIMSRRMELTGGLTDNQAAFIGARRLFELVDQSCACTSETLTLISCRSLDQLPDEHLCWLLDALFVVGRRRLRLMLIGGSSPSIYRRCGNLRPSSEMLLQFAQADDVAHTLS
jgi:hypothetical protein